MSNSPHFAFDVVACALLGIGLWAACAGIGYRILPRTSPPDGQEAAGWRQPGIAACVGLGVLVMLGGIAVALRVPWWLPVAAFLDPRSGAGRAGSPRLRHDPGAGAARPVLVIGCVAVAAFLVVALAESLVGLRLPTNTCDDLRAYLPMARRLLDTNAIIEPWSLRRLQNLGGFTFLQALPVAAFGNAGAGVAETTIGGVFLAGLFVANGFRSTWARVLNVAFILAIPLCGCRG